MAPRVEHEARIGVCGFTFQCSACSRKPRFPNSWLGVVRLGRLLRPREAQEEAVRRQREFEPTSKLSKTTDRRTRESPPRFRRRAEAAPVTWIRETPAL